MTRKGTQQVAWTTQELAYLLANAGEKSIAEISAELGRTVASTREQWRRHRAQGSSTRTDKRPVCQSCFQRRTYMATPTQCRICASEEALVRSEQRCSKAIAILPVEAKEVYSRAESRRGSRPVAPPKAPNLAGMSRKAARRAETRWESQCEAARLATLKRQIDANKTRLRRIREKLGTNPRK